MSVVASPLHQILDAARWAPSGDNTQPWRFEIKDELHVVVHGSDTRHHCVYDLDGHPSQLSLGALLETLRLAATGFGLRADVVRRRECSDEHPTFDVRLVQDDRITPSPLIPSIPRRSVQRKPFSPRALTTDEKSALEGAVGPGYSLRWIEGWGPKWDAARLMFHNAKLRLTMEEAYRVHRDIIDWGRRYSEERVPDQALGADPVSLGLMRWAMRDWSRVKLMNRWLAGTWIPRLQMDLLPGVMCGAHVVLVCDQAPTDIDAHVDAGRQVQRLWLTATRLGLQHQPEITPLVFARYVRDRVAFSTDTRAIDLAGVLARRSEALIGPDLPRVAWLGRIGQASFATSRCVRLPLTDLMFEGELAEVATSKPLPPR